MEQIRKILDAHGLEEVAFTKMDSDAPWYAAYFEFQGRSHEIEIYQHGPVMHRDRQLFEPYLREEFDDNIQLAESFARRLDSYLRGGSWDVDRS